MSKEQKRRLGIGFIFIIPIFLIGIIVACNMGEMLDRDNPLDSGAMNYDNTLDSTVPTASIVSPTHGQSLSNSVVQITGTAEDPVISGQQTSGIQGVYVRINTSIFHLASGTTNWSFNTNLGEGSYTLSYYAKDVIGNIGTTNLISFSVITNIADIFSPNLEITNFTEGTNLQVSNFYIRGWAADTNGSGIVSTGIDQVYVSLDANAFTVASGTTTWAKYFVGVSDGSHTVRVYCKDNAGNSSRTNELTLTITANLPDLLDPTCSLTNISNGDALWKTAFTVYGTATDPTSVSSSASGIYRVYIKIDNGSFNIATGTTAWSYYYTGVSESNHTLYYYTVDNTNRYSVTNTVIFSVDTSLGDTQAPQCEITNMTNLHIIPHTNFTVAGTATDPETIESPSSGVSNVYVQLDGGSRYKATGTNDWNWNYTGVSRTNHTVSAYSQDRKKNSSPTNVITIKVVEVGKFGTSSFGSNEYAAFDGQ